MPSANQNTLFNSIVGKKINLFNSLYLTNPNKIENIKSTKNVNEYQKINKIT